MQADRSQATHVFGVRLRQQHLQSSVRKEAHLQRPSNCPCATTRAMSQASGPLQAAWKFITIHTQPPPVVQQGKT